MEIDASHFVGYNLYDTRYGGIRTLWGLIQDFQGAEPASPARHRAFNAVYTRYAQAVYGYIRRQYRRLPITDAQDIAAEVLAVLSGPGGLATYNPSEGKFRPWLRTLIQHRANNLIKYHHRDKRDRRCTLALDDLETNFQEDVADYAGPLEYLEVQAVLATVNEAVNGVRDVYRAKGIGRVAKFDALRVYLPGANVKPPTHAEMAQRLGMTADAVKAEVCRLKKSVKAQLILSVRESLRGAPAEAVKREIASMADILARHFRRPF